MSTTQTPTALLHLLADIRTAAGDPQGTLMQDELVKHIAQMRDDVDVLRGAFHNACEGIDAMNRASLGKGETTPVGPAVSRIQQLKAERDALASHAAVLSTELQSCQSVLFQLARDGQVTMQYADDAKKALARSPDHCLKRRDAAKRAEGLEIALDAIKYMEREVPRAQGTLDALQDEIADLLKQERQQQAEGGS